MNKIIATETELKFSAAYLPLPPILERRESKMIVCLGGKMACARACVCVCVRSRACAHVHTCTRVCLSGIGCVDEATELTKYRLPSFTFKQLIFCVLTCPLTRARKIINFCTNEDISHRTDSLPLSASASVPRRHGYSTPRSPTLGEHRWKTCFE